MLQQRGAAVAQHALGQTAASYCLAVIISRIVFADLEMVKFNQLLRIYGVRAVQLRRIRLSDIDWYNNSIDFPAAKNGLPV